MIEASTIMLSGLQFWVVVHTRREANMVAHLLAKATLQTPVGKILMEEYLAFLHDIVSS